MLSANLNCPLAAKHNQKTVSSVSLGDRLPWNKVKGDDLCILRDVLKTVRGGRNIVCDVGVRSCNLRCVCVL